MWPTWPICWTTRPSTRPSEKPHGESIERLKAEGQRVGKRILLPSFDYLVPAYYVLTTAEASSNLSRYDGIRYGRRSPRKPWIWKQPIKNRAAKDFGKGSKTRTRVRHLCVERRFLRCLNSRRARKVRRVVTDAMHRLLERSDILLIPTTPDTAFKFGENSGRSHQNVPQDIFTVLANITGHPAISFPLRYSGRSGLPSASRPSAVIFDSKETLLQDGGFRRRNNLLFGYRFS